MISRVAEQCFWLNRYIERADTIARIASVNRFTVLDADLHDAERWKPVVVVMGEQERFERLFGTEGYNDDVTSEDYLTWSEESAVSIKSSLYWARENARMTREVISREMWETVNTWWQWLNSKEARKEYVKDRIQFYQRIRSMCAEFQGVCHNTMLHEEPFHFLRLGMLLERGTQTARVLDVKHHWLTLDQTADGESPRESAQWFAILRLCAAAEPFLKRTRSAPTGPVVAKFLLQDSTFPRSVLHCFERMENFLHRIEKDAGRTKAPSSKKAVAAVVKRLRSADIRKVLRDGLHEELTHMIDTGLAVGDQVATDFFSFSHSPDVEQSEALP